MENNTKICKACKSEIAKDAKICPNCRKKQGGIIKWIIIAIVVIGIFGVAGSGGNDEASDSNPKKVGTTDEKSYDNNDKENENKSFEVGDVVETSDLKISFISAGEYVEDNEYLQPSEGKMYYKAEFEIENLGDDDVTVSSMLNWTCYADDYEMDQSFVGEDTLDGTISSGKKLKGSLYYEVPEETQEVVLEYKFDLLTGDKVVFIAK